MTIIGGGGHVGAFLVPALRARGHEVLVADLKPGQADDGDPARYQQVNALSASQVNEAIRDADLVVHMAVVLAFTPEQRADPERVSRAYGVNVGSVVTCLEQCLLLDKPMVHISSMSVFARYGQVPVDPSGPGDATDFYGFTKRLSEVACRDFAAQHPVRVTSLRLAFPTPDDLAPRWLLPHRTEAVQQRMDDGTPIAALPASQLAVEVERCRDMPVGHTVRAVTAAPQTLLPS
ncbi:NAD-dependent epimerase/dehydratase family protein [Propionibacteriaceae bacterium Y1923]